MRGLQNIKMSSWASKPCAKACQSAVAVVMVLSTMLSGAISIFPVKAAQAAETKARRVDLRPGFNRYRLTIKVQGARDTCHVFTVVAALEYAVARKYNYGVGLSEEYLNWAANQASKQAVDGATFMELAQGLKRWGVCEEEFMPYGPAFNPAQRPSSEALDSAREIHNLNFRWHWIKAPVSPDTKSDADNSNQLRDSHIESIKDVLRKGWPVCAGREHNVLIVGFHDDAQQPGGGNFIIRNSNSRNYRTMTYADTKANSNVALWIDLPLDE
jgi:hypothetical protein